MKFLVLFASMLAVASCDQKTTKSITEEDLIALGFTRRNERPPIFRGEGKIVKTKVTGELASKSLNDSETPCIIESDGWLNIDTLFGVLNNKTGIVAMTKSLVNLIPPGFIVVGDSFGGGNFFGQFRGDRRIFYFNHEATYEGEELTLVADDFDSILKALRPKPPLPDSDYDGIVEVVTSDEFTAAMERWKAEQETAPQPELHRYQHETMRPKSNDTDSNDTRPRKN